MWTLLLLTFSLLCGTASICAAQTPAVPFDEWLQEFRVEARGRGYSEALLDQALTGLVPSAHVLASDRRQPERILAFEEYLRRRLTPALVRQGHEFAHQHQDLLTRVRDAYGVPPQVIVAILGIESLFGQHRGEMPVFQALATLAWDPRRARFFRAQLYDALTMVDRGHIDASSMKGSWAGAMGQPQFMPSSYLAYAVDFDGDGRRDIWTSEADTFASISNYLRSHGWRADEPWGHEVQVTAATEKRIASLPSRDPECPAMRTMTRQAPLAEWQRLGVRRVEAVTCQRTAQRPRSCAAGRDAFWCTGTTMRSFATTARTSTR